MSGGTYHNNHPDKGTFATAVRSDLACADCGVYYQMSEWTSHDGTRTDFKHYCPGCARVIWVEGKRP